MNPQPFSIRHHLRWRISQRVTSAFGGVPLSRREAMHRCLFGSAGLLLMEPFAVRAEQAAPPAAPVR